jgi:hypothetical protein
LPNENVLAADVGEGVTGELGDNTGRDKEKVRFGRDDAADGEGAGSFAPFTAR